MESKYERKKEGGWDSMSPAKTQARNQMTQLDIPSHIPDQKLRKE